MPHAFHHALTALAVIAATVFAPSAQATDKLPTNFKIDAEQTSVSGLSSGAFMAVQLQVAYSGSIAGSGIIAGGPYYCAAGSVMNSSVCMGYSIFPLTTNLMVQAAQSLADKGQIDSLSNLAKRRVYVFSGTKDTVVLQPAVKATADFFTGAGVPAQNLLYENKVAAGHAVITPAAGNSCGTNNAPYINHCTVSGAGYDQAGILLKHIYGTLQAKASTPSGKLLSFDQRDYAASNALMADEGYLYVPQACAQGQSCKVHVALHGCGQSAASVGDKFTTQTGYNQWADTNHMLVLYPQVNASFPSNMAGCWDWFAYTGNNYATKSAPQMAAIMGMVKALGSNPEAK